MVKNRAHVEGSICENYLSQETTHFCTYYFESDVETSRTRVGRNDEGEQRHPPISVFNHPGRPSGKSTTKFLTDKEYYAAHLHILLNCEEVNPYIELFEQQLRHQNPNIPDNIIQTEISKKFPAWFREYVYNPLNGYHPPLIKQIAYGPLRKVKLWNIYFINGYKFHTKDKSDGMKTMNNGVCVKASDDPDDENYFYGRINEIVQIEYTGEPTKEITLFNCDWFDNTPIRGVKVNKVHGIVEVRHRGRYTAYDPFIFVSNAIQVFYVPYPEGVRSKSDWWVVIRTKPRGTVDDRYTLEVAYQEPASVVSAITEGEEVAIDNLRHEDNILEEREEEDGEEEDGEEREEQEEEEEHEDVDEDDYETEEEEEEYEDQDEEEGMEDDEEVEEDEDDD